GTGDREVEAMPATGGGGAWRGAAARTATLARVPPFGLTGRAGIDWRGWLKACIAQEVEQRRLFPWIAVSFGIGVLLFFAAEGRPALWAPLVGAALLIAAAYALRGRPIGLA